MIENPKDSSPVLLILNGLVVLDESNEVKLILCNGEKFSINEIAFKINAISAVGGVLILQTCSTAVPRLATSAALALVEQESLHVALKMALRDWHVIWLEYPRGPLISDVTSIWESLFAICSPCSMHHSDVDSAGLCMQVRVRSFLLNAGMDPHLLTAYFFAHQSPSSYLLRGVDKASMHQFVSSRLEVSEMLMFSLSQCHSCMGAFLVELFTSPLERPKGAFYRLVPETTTEIQNKMVQSIRTLPSMKRGRVLHHFKSLQVLSSLETGNLANALIADKMESIAWSVKSLELQSVKV